MMQLKFGYSKLCKCYSNRDTTDSISRTPTEEQLNVEQETEAKSNKKQNQIKRTQKKRG